MSDATITRGKLFKEDIAIANGGTGAEETGQRLTSAGGLITLTKLDLGHIPYRSFPGTPEDLIDGDQDIDILPKDIDAAGDCNIDGTLIVGGVTRLKNLSSAGYVKNSATGVLSTGSISATDLPTGIDVAKLADGSVSNTELQYINTLASNVQNQLNTIVAGATVQASFALLQNRQAQNTAGGTATSGSWLIVPINTEKEDTDNIVDSTALPAFSLAAGTYRFEVICPFSATVRSQCRIYNVTDAAVSIVGSSVTASSDATSTSNSHLIGTVTIAATKQFRLEYQVGSTSATLGLGYPANYGAEVYAQVKIVKLA